MSETKTVWHPVRLVPYDPAKHAEIFEDMPTPEEVWEGEMPSEEGEYLVTTKGGYVGLDEFDIDGDRCWFETYDIVAWAELPAPYKPEEKK